jgi:hypothetical protein
MNLHPPGTLSSPAIGSSDAANDGAVPSSPPLLPPPLDAGARAFEVFSDAYFSPRPDLGRQRHKVLGTKTVGGVLNECGRTGDSQFLKLAAATGINQEAMLQYLRQPMDRALARVGYLSLRRSDAVDDFLRQRRGNSKGAAPAGTHKIVEAPRGSSPVRDSPRRRTFPLWCYVLGPGAESGTGPADAAAAAATTNYALQHLKDFGNREKLPSVVVYWELWARHGSGSGDLAGNDDVRAPSILVGHFLELLAYRLQSTYRRTWSPKRHKLESLHVCAVVDGIETTEQKQFFEDPANVSRFARELAATEFAASLMVAVLLPAPTTTQRVAAMIEQAAAGPAATNDDDDDDDDDDSAHSYYCVFRADG